MPTRGSQLVYNIAMHPQSLPTVGISGLALSVPPYRVALKDWSEWTGTPWEKTEAVVGRGFRMKGPSQSVYTLAANATLKLIQQYDIDPGRVSFLGLGTESSTDNSAGAIIVRGMLDDALRSIGKSPISRGCEVPEFKHACLGGVYAMKAALRYLATEGEERQAIVVSADVAEYERGTSGEPTQGAGAVAMLLERSPKLLEVQLGKTGSASLYRGVDFRKPALRKLIHKTKLNGHLPDHPVFNGKYSATCYLNQTLHALSDMLRKLGLGAREYLESLAAVFMHRPFQRMPETSLALNYLVSLAGDGDSGRNLLRQLCDGAEISFARVVEEMRAPPEALGNDLNNDNYPLTMKLLRYFRARPEFEQFVTTRLELGSGLMAELGNLYSAALPAWIGAGLEQAVKEGRQLAGKSVLAMGYGSGDAAEALPMTVVAGWEEAARKLSFASALAGDQKLSQSQYEALHDFGHCQGLIFPSAGEFVVSAVGSSQAANYTDEGIEYYRYLG